MKEASKCAIVALTALVAASCASAGALNALRYGCTDTPVSVMGAFFAGFDYLPNGDFVVNDGYSVREINSQGAVVKTLYTFDGSVFGSFVEYRDGKLYFGESSYGRVYSMDYSIPGTASMLVDLDLNFDIAFWNGSPYIVAGDTIYLVGSGGQTDAIAVAGPYSGPLEFDSAGNLYYAPGNFPNATTILRWSAAQVASAVGPTHLSAGDAEPLATVSGAYDLDWLAPGKLAFTNNSLAPPGIQVQSSGALWTLATSTISGAWMANVRCDPATGRVFAAVGWYDQQWNSYSVISALTPIPEPSSIAALLALTGLAASARLLRCRGK